MAQKQVEESDTLKKLEQLLIEDVKKNRSRKEKIRSIWKGVAFRLITYAVLIVFFTLFHLIENPRMAVLFFLFFVFIECFRFYKLDMRIMKILRRR